MGEVLLLKLIIAPGVVKDCNVSTLTSNALFATCKWLNFLLC